jgi:branched-chain amino acid transport system substrate-binding protein
VKSAVVVASVGNYSGPAASSLLPILKGAQIWVKYVNDRGGVNGHLVKLLVYDDGADTARHRAQLQDAVERQKVIAFLAQGAPLTGEGGLGYISEKRIPVIGTETGSYWVYEHPMFFPQGTSGYPLFYATIAGASQQLVPAGKTKVGWITCAEVPQCDNFAKLWKDSAPKLGLQPVFESRASLAQPDFTAECLSARNAGVQALIVGMDSNTVGRVAASCARQSYRPVFSTVAGIVIDDWKTNPDFEGLIVATNFYPYFQPGLPATDEYLQALRTYGNSSLKGIQPETGWVAGKLLEKAAAGLPEPPTSEALLKALWAIKGDTLGGITSPLTFVENQNAPIVTCWYNLTIKQGGWASADGAQQHCQNGIDTNGRQ